MMVLRAQLGVQQCTIEGFRGGIEVYGMRIRGLGIRF